MLDKPDPPDERAVHPGRVGDSSVLPKHMLKRKCVHRPAEGLKHNEEYVLLWTTFFEDKNSNANY